ncbi:LutC/YkgG family protein [Streptomyces armeniacus]|uniref:LutC/YkgG family protein n=1 Tax=Streptomyces armeniacus TaxID=83291 RepID=UPI001AD7E696|nr:LUD domain-containing protein [Streptomyces armeniacus]
MTGGPGPRAGGAHGPDGAPGADGPHGPDGAPGPDEAARQLAARADRFAAALDAVGGTCHRVADADAARAVVERLCGPYPVAVHREPLVDRVTAGLHRVADPWAAETGVTSALAAVADTGTLALAYDGARPRGTSLVPPRHVAVVPATRLVDSYADAVGRLAALSPAPSGMQLITGPSSSGDIEMVQVRGMHGPLAVHVVLVGPRLARADRPSCHEAR